MSPIYWNDIPNTVDSGRTHMKSLEFIPLFVGLALCIPGFDSCFVAHNVQ